MYLALRTDSEITKMYLLNDSGEEIKQEEWLSERRLADELLGRLEGFLKSANQTWDDVTGLVVFLGPGSFTGLRIGITVMNTIAFTKHIPIAGTKHDDWLVDGASQLANGEDDKQCVPFYGAEPNITKPKR
ncbi:tRNA (adenosine(37)-N6)-threonylcarbamoyltransferase complex dimerization subunit type 1 TsaB [Patescibacteria group bacterium]|nr:MAG: tRNA (adenosine(37)-N6)-threonylcarbamoyltransferase complex dimerization subunit type 1 TsaB [Patescibacteria group bacterium]